MDAKTLIGDCKRRAYGDDAAESQPLGEMLPNGFRVGEAVQHTYSPYATVYVVRSNHPDTHSASQPNAVAYEYERRGSNKRGWDMASDVRRLSPPAQPESMQAVMGGTSAPGKAAALKSAMDAYAAIHPGAVIAEATVDGVRYVSTKPAAPLCPCCRDTPLRLVGEAQDVYRCGHCSWTGSAEGLAKARKRGQAAEPLPWTDCPACGPSRAVGPTCELTPHGIRRCTECGWSGGPLLAAAKREACKPKMRFKVGDRVRTGSGSLVQIMEVLDGGYAVVDLTYRSRAEQWHGVRESDLQPWPAEAP